MSVYYSLSERSESKGIPYEMPSTPIVESSAFTTEQAPVEESSAFSTGQAGSGNKYLYFYSLSERSESKGIPFMVCLQ
jgi:hypothetical protein